MKVTIITTCFNAEKSIKKTIESVLEQTYCDFEYVITDGGSKDKTVAIAKSYEDKFKERNIPFAVYEEPDKGIYDGMNHGVAHAKGNYICFMNADDTFFDENVLNDIFSNHEYPENAILYGDAAELEYGEYYYFTKDFSKIKEKMPFSHQSVFAAKNLLEKFPLNLKYKIAADYDFLINCYLDKVSFIDVNRLVCVVSKDGVSSVNLYDCFLETENMLKAHGIERYSEKALKKKLFFLRIRQLGMDYLPAFIKKAIRKMQRKKRGQNKKVGEI